MATNVLQLDDRTYARAKELAEERHVTVERLVSDAIEQLASKPAEKTERTNIIGAFADCADLMDEIVEEAYQNRERRPLRVKSE